MANVLRLAALDLLRAIRYRQTLFTVLHAFLRRSQVIFVFVRIHRMRIRKNGLGAVPQILLCERFSLGIALA
jgi:hypothetical protein